MGLGLIKQLLPPNSIHRKCQPISCVQYSQIFCYLVYIYISGVWTTSSPSSYSRYASCLDMVLVWNPYMTIVLIK